MKIFSSLNFGGRAEDLRRPLSAETGGDPIYRYTDYIQTCSYSRRLYDSRAKTQGASPMRHSGVGLTPTRDLAFDRIEADRSSLGIGLLHLAKSVALSFSPPTHSL